MLKLFDFANIFYDIKSDNFFNLGKYLYELYYLLPEESYKFLMDLQIDSCL